MSRRRTPVPIIDSAATIGASGKELQRALAAHEASKAKHKDEEVAFLKAKLVPRTNLDRTLKFRNHAERMRLYVALDKTVATLQFRLNASEARRRRQQDCAAKERAAHDQQLAAMQQKESDNHQAEDATLASYKAQLEALLEGAQAFGKDWGKYRDWRGRENRWEDEQLKVLRKQAGGRTCS